MVIIRCYPFAFASNVANTLSGLLFIIIYVPAGRCTLGVGMGRKGALRCGTLKCFPSVALNCIVIISYCWVPVSLAIRICFVPVAVAVALVCLSSHLCVH